MGWSVVYIVQGDGLEFTLFSEMVLSSHCSVGWFGVHIVSWGGLEFTLLSYTLKLFSYVIDIKTVFICERSEVSNFETYW